MLKKELQKYIVYPRGKKAEKKPFFELIKENLIKGKKGEKKRRYALEVDKIVYGK